MNELRVLGLSVLLGAALASPTRSEMPPITPADWAAKAPADDPTAPAIVLHKRSELELQDLDQQTVSSTLRLEQRIKVLTREGLEKGELEIAHSRFFRLQSLVGRTLLADGRVIPLAADSKFERRLSERRKSWVTAVAFPAIEVGAIVEYEAVLRFESVFFLEPLFLSDTLPVLSAEAAFVLPRNLGVRTWGRDPFEVGVQNETKEEVQRVRIRYWARNLPAVPSEPMGPPFEDLATRYGIVATVFRGSELVQLFEHWPGTCAFVQRYDYKPARDKGRGVAARTREIVGQERDSRKKAELLYRFVRDQIRTDPEPGVMLAPDESLGAVLARGSGDNAAKGLLLHTMLGEAGVPSRLVWANERSTGLALFDVPSPGWFERVLATVELPSGRVFLDPSEPGLPFGVLPADVEGSQGVLFDVKEPKPLELPALSAEENRREAKLALSLDEEGRISGTGTLLFSGQHAVAAIGDAAATEDKYWQGWLQEQLPGFRVEAVVALAAENGEELRLTWRMGQLAEDVLGDEATLLPSLPLGPVTNPLTLPAAQRLTPVLYPFPDRDEVNVELTYPAGWRVEDLPPSIDQKNGAGALRFTSSVDEATRTIRLERVLDVTLRAAGTRESYAEVQALLAAAARHDAQRLGLARSG